MYEFFVMLKLLKVFSGSETELSYNATCSSESESVSLGLKRWEKDSGESSGGIGGHVRDKIMRDSWL